MTTFYSHYLIINNVSSYSFDNLHYADIRSIDHISPMNILISINIFLASVISCFIHNYHRSVYNNIIFIIELRSLTVNIRTAHQQNIVNRSPLIFVERSKHP